LEKGLMINTEKIRLMTKAELLAKKQGKDNYLASHYYAYDYISVQVIKAAIGITIAYVIGVALWFLTRVDQILQENKISYVFVIVRDFTVLYVAVLILTLLVCSLIYASRYWKARKSMGEYVDSLRRLNQFYNKESKNDGNNDSKARR
jgi:H+/Cl- antiporter ClcA